ncbi:MAG: transcriptional regulator NrdR [Acidimicrobiia bacterium]
MHCPSCRADDTKVVDSRVAEEGAAIRRRRQCPRCAYRFTTFERMEEVPLIVVKSSGLREPFDRAKIARGVRSAGKGRPITDEQIDELAEAVEERIRVQGAETTSARVGLAVLEQLRQLDEVVYLRFASVYKSFGGVADFHRELELLEKSSSSAE